MSKLIECMQKSYLAATPSIGFKVRTDTPRIQNMPFVAKVSPNNMDLITDILEIGVDALLIQLEENQQTKSIITGLSKKIKDIPWGILSKNLKEEQIQQLIDAGCDFIIFEAREVPASIIEQKKLGKIVIVNQSLHDDLIETICQLPVDAVFFDMHEEPLPSMMDLMKCQYYADLTDKPLFSLISPEITTSSLVTLHKYSIDGVIIEIKIKGTLKQAANLRQIINKLPPVKGRGKKKEGLIPSLGGLSSSSSETDDDYEEEEI